MFTVLDLLLLLGGAGLVGSAPRMGRRAETCERAGGALVVGALLGLGLLLARSSG